MRITTLVPLVSLIGILNWIGWNKIDTSTLLHFNTSPLHQPSPTSEVPPLNNSTFSSSPFTSPLPQSSTSTLHLACDRRSDSLELVKFYNATGGPTWLKKWDLKKPMETWWGILLNNNGCIQGIELSDSSLNQGSAIDFDHGNNLKGSLFDINLEFLEFLSLSGNLGLQGNLPDFKFLPNLKVLSISGCNLSGEIPDFKYLQNLIYLGLSGNKLTGTLPSFINLNKLKYLFLGTAGVGIPYTDIGTNHYPNYIHFEQYGGNNLNGTIPNLNFNRNLYYLYLSRNKFTFQDIFPNLKNNFNYSYSPQQKIYTDTTILIPTNSTYTLDLRIDDTVTTSTYTWYKNNILYKTIKGSNKLPFSPFISANAGTYTVKITNPHAPQLTLESYPIRLVSGPSLVCDRRSDSLELVKFYNATGGPNWKVKWELNKPINTWWGISVNNEGCILRIDMDGDPQFSRIGTTNKNFGNNLTGFLPDLSLSKLEILEILNNYISGSIPDFSNLPLLKQLFISNNEFSGVLPDFSNLPQLKSLYCRNNNLSGKIPSLNDLKNIQSLDLSHNQLKDFPLSFNGLNFLWEIDLSANDINSTIPDFSYLDNIQKLNLSNNKMTFVDIIINIGSIEKKIKQISNTLDTLIYSPQQPIYTDTTILIPANATYTLDLLIDDTVTTSTYTWYKNNILYKTIKGSNKLPFSPFTAADAGTYTVKITNPHAPQLTLESYPIRLVASPSLVCDRRSDSLELVKFYDSTGGKDWTTKWDLSKPISSWWGITLSSEGCVTKIELDKSNNLNCCDGNNLIGVLPSLRLPELKAISVFNNQLAGSIPDLNEIPKLEDLVLSKNKFTGSIPDFTNLPVLKNLAIQDNPGINGSIPDFKNLPGLETIKLERNGLTGAIPDFSNTPKLKLLNLFRNSLNGPIPDFKNLKALEIMDIGGNSLTGTIPNFNNLPKLERFIAGDNMLSGALPDFSLLPNLKLIGLNKNKLNGYLYNYSITNKLLSSLDIFDNQYTFYGLIQHTKVVSSLTKSSSIGFSTDSFTYSPQAKVFVDTTIYINQNSNYTLDLKFDDTVTTSTYTWYKNNVLYKSIKGSNKLPFAPFTSADAGTYTVKITNPHAPQLTLESHPIRLNGLCHINLEFNITIDPRCTAEKMGSISYLIKENLNEGPYTYTWFKNDEPMPEFINKSITPNQKVDLPLTVNDVYQFVVTGNGCNKAANKGSLSGSCPELKCDRRSDSLELVRFFNSCGGNEWKIKWDFTKPINTWYGIQLTPEGCVKTISLQDNRVSGNLIALNLSDLQVLDLPVNNLGGPLPAFNQLKKLTNLNLRQNAFTGSFPNIDSLTGLTSLILLQNNLTGNLPILNNHKKLRELNWGLNNFKGYFSDNSVLHPLLISNTFNDNKLTFEGLIQNIEKVRAHIQRNEGLNSFVYAPQQKVFHDTTITVDLNKPFELKLDFDDTVSTSTYSWYKNGVLTRTVKGNNKLSFNLFTIADIGTYTVKITNPHAPQLTLESFNIKLMTTNCSIPILLKDLSRNDTFCTVFKLPVYRLPISYNTRLDGSGIEFFMGNDINASYKLYVTVDSIGCKTIDSVNYIRKSIFIDPKLINEPCTPIFDALPKITGSNLTGNEAFYSEKNGNGKKYVPGDTVIAFKRNHLYDSKILYMYDSITYSSGKCVSEVPVIIPFFSIVELENQIDTNINCNSTFVLPNKTSYSYFKPTIYTEPNKKGNSYSFNTPLPKLGTYYIYGSVSKCFDEDTFKLYIDSGPIYSGNLDLKECNKVTLPEINGSKFLKDSTFYFIQPLGLGARFKPGAEINSNLNLYIYDLSQKCINTDTINVTISAPPNLDLKISKRGCDSLPLPTDDSVGTNIRYYLQPGAVGAFKLPGEYINATTPFYKYTGNAQCFSEKPFRLEIEPSPQINLIKDTTVCDEFRLPVIKGNLLSGTEHYHDDSYPKEKIDLYPGTLITKSTKLVAFDWNKLGCVNERSFNITIIRNSDILLKPDTQIVKYQNSANFNLLSNDNIPKNLKLQITIQQSSNGKITYSTSTGIGNFQSNNKFYGKEILDYTVCYNNCCNTSTITFNVESPCSDKTNLKLPNIIFPNETGINRYFHVEAIGKCPDAFGPKPTSLKVFNRWGDLVYSNNAYKNDWDGENNKGQPLPDGTYYYLLDMGSQGGPVKGWVVIMR